MKAIKNASRVIILILTAANTDNARVSEWLKELGLGPSGLVPSQVRILARA